jgi:DNA-binding transcriptional MerR regulator
MATMKEVCNRVGISYETLRYYCNEGLVPEVKRDKNNYRDFDDQDISWLMGLQCLRKCGMSIKDMKIYMELCKKGISTIPERKRILHNLNKSLLQKHEEINECIDFINKKQIYFDDVISGKTEYKSNLTWES